MPNLPEITKVDEYPYEGREPGYKWTVEFTVAESIVVDGFDLDAERAHEMLAQNLPFAYGYELGAKIVKSPRRARIRKAQGYND